MAPLSPIDDEVSCVEPRPRAAKPEAKRAIGRMPAEESVSVAAPSPVKKGRKSAPPAAVGLRAAPRQPQAVSTEAHDEVREKLRQEQDLHRKRVWDKLDAARKKAEEKKPRLAGFQPHRRGRGGHR